MERILAESRDPQELLSAWQGWHSIAPPMRERYARLVELGNRGARELGFADVGAMWRSGYDMPADEFSKELDRLWEQVRPLYVSLHSYARWKLAEKYGKDVVSEDQPIPAHLLGNMWAQDWSYTYPLLAPPGNDKGVDLTGALRARNTDARGMVKYGENFFTSLGFAPLPGSFWERSLFTKPRDRDVVCHASAWSMDFKDDLRIKMCVEIDAEDFSTIHHELGHNFYARAYNQLSPLFQNSANDGFHEAIGDTIALSVTPEYLKQIGLIETVPPASGDIGLLLGRALEKVAFLPFGLLVDQWRWKVFSGEIKPADYNTSWWDLRRKYQGVAPPVARSEADFDPGAKYHIPANVPYTRYFLATILQFQFHRALCREIGYTGPLHRCSIYGNKAAGAKLAKMLAMGQSRPWPEALEALTGERHMDASAMLDYFAPLKKWLDEQNAGHTVRLELAPGFRNDHSPASQPLRGFSRRGDMIHRLHRKSWRWAGMLLLLAAGGCNSMDSNTGSGSPPSGTPPPQLALSAFMTGLNAPVGFEIAPNDPLRRIFIVEKAGTIRAIQGGVLQTRLHFSTSPVRWMLPARKPASWDWPFIRISPPTASSTSTIRGPSAGSFRL